MNIPLFPKYKTHENKYGSNTISCPSCKAEEIELNDVVSSYLQGCCMENCGMYIVFQTKSTQDFEHLSYLVPFYVQSIIEECVLEDSGFGYDAGSDITGMYDDGGNITHPGSRDLMNIFHQRFGYTVNEFSFESSDENFHLKCINPKGQIVYIYSSWI